MSEDMSGGMSIDMSENMSKENVFDRELSSRSWFGSFRNALFRIEPSQGWSRRFLKNKIKSCFYVRKMSNLSHMSVLNPGGEGAHLWFAF